MFIQGNLNHTADQKTFWPVWQSSYEAERHPAEQDGPTQGKEEHLSNTRNDALVCAAFLPLCLLVPEQ